jgi:anti-anti-sigma factor
VTIVVDLRGVSYMDSTGINCLLEAKALAEPLGKGVPLLTDSGQPSRALELTGLVGSFEMIDELRQLGSVGAGGVAQP